MKRDEQARLFLRKAAQDEALLDEVIESTNIADEVFGYHCQQAAEKLLKAVLSSRGLAVRKTHDLGMILELLTEDGCPPPAKLESLDSLTAFGSVYRYEDYESEVSFDRREARAMLRSLRAWCESHIPL